MRRCGQHLAGAGTSHERSGSTRTSSTGPLQENLGEHQDTEVHTAQLRSIAKELEGSPKVGSETFLAIGRLTELFARRRLAARALFAERFGSYDTKTTAQALADMLGAARKP